MPAVWQPHKPDTFRRRVWPGKRVPTATVVFAAAAGRPGSGGLHLSYLYSSPWRANTEWGGGVGWAGQETVPEESKQYFYEHFFKIKCGIS